MNPHERNAHKILSLARLPVPTLPHIAFLRDSLSSPSRQVIVYQSAFCMSTVFSKKIQKYFLFIQLIHFVQYQSETANFSSQNLYYDTGYASVVKRAASSKRPPFYLTSVFFYMDQSKMISAMNTRSVSPVLVRPCPFPSGVMVMSPAFTGRFTPLSSYSPSPLKI